jgi:ribosomal protein S18 acetylase RimI-like enzyme
MVDLTFKNLDVSYLDVVDTLESASYPEDEKATREKLQLRLEKAPELFMGAFNSNNELIGFICSTATHSSTLTHETMSQHESGGGTVCIHSVVVDNRYRRKGIGSRMLEEYLKLPFVKSINQLCLLSKQHLISFYQNAGFELLGESSVSHGSERWYDLRYIVHNQ